MANNIPIKDSTGTEQILETQETSPGSGIHTPLHIVKTLPEEPLGASSDAAITSDTGGRVVGFLRGLVKWAYERMPASLGQKTMANSLAVVLPSDQSITISDVTLDAAENHIGSVGGKIAVVTTTPTITAGAYAINDCVGGILAIANCARVAAGDGSIASAMLYCKSNITPALELLVFDANPSASTFTDNSGASIHANDIGKLIGSIRFKDYVNIGTTNFSQILTDFPFAIPSGTTLYFALIVRGENGLPTFGSTADLVLRLWVNQN